MVIQEKVDLKVNSTFCLYTRELLNGLLSVVEKYQLDGNMAE